MDIRSRIIGHGSEDPKELIAHPRNWRRHPKIQVDAMRETLNRVGWVQNIIVNTTTGTMLDGHMRVEIAAEDNLAEIPVTYIEVTEDEETLILATFDPLGDLALKDEDMLEGLMESIQDDHRSLLEDVGVLAKSQKAKEPTLGDFSYSVIVECDGEQDQADLLERLEGEGLSCKALIL